MKDGSADMFVCLACGSSLGLNELPRAQSNGGSKKSELVCVSCGAAYPIVRSIPRFVASEEYAHSFGYQWTRFPTLQLDRHMRNDLSRERFFATSKWEGRLDGQRVLEAGCGMGRFTQIVLETGAEVFSFDLSNAVEANFENNGGSKRVHIFQASIYQIPLCRASFDKIFCMGVLQHCPDVRGAFLALVPFLRSGGEIVIDVYQRREGLFPPLKYWVRPWVTWLGPNRVHKLLSWTIPPAFETKKALCKIPWVGKPLGSLVPIGPISHKPKFDYTDEELKQVKILSALDMLSPAHDHPQTIETVQGWFVEAGLTDVHVGTGFNGINARGRRP